MKRAMPQKTDFTNADIAQMLRRVAAVYEIREDRFRSIAYQRAADSIEHAAVEVKDLWDEGKLDTLPGIGKNLAQHLNTFFKTGHVPHFEKLFRTVPASVFIFLEIPGVGPKTAYRLACELKIKEEKGALEKLKEAAKTGKISQIPGFGEKSAKEILEGILALEKESIIEKRMLLPYADRIAQEIINYLKKSPAVLEAYPLGSLRRQVATIGDIDIAVKTEKPKEVIHHFTNYPKIKKVLERGEKALCRVILRNNRQIDLRTQAPQNFGAMLQYFTGSKHHNIALREFALKKGLSLSEHGIKKVKSQSASRRIKVKSFATEKAFYHYLGLGWIPPELREGSGEIEAAAKGKLPRLVKKKDIKGDLHLHSNFEIEPSHDLGKNAMEEMVAWAITNGYEYLAFSEHNPSLSQHREKEIIDLIKRKKEQIEQINYSIKKGHFKRAKNVNFYVLNSLEVDIRPDGCLALPEKALELLDFLIVSIHTQFNLSQEKMTQRILKGLKHPKAKILGHPTGRLLNEREGYELNWEKVFSFCQKNNKILEVNAYPNRLDLPDFLIREAVRRKIKLAINTDSHALEQMEFIKYGVATARRGWAQKEDIINTQGVGEIKKILLS